VRRAAPRRIDRVRIYAKIHRARRRSQLLGMYLVLALPGQYETVSWMFWPYDICEYQSKEVEDKKYLEIVEARINMIFTEKEQFY